MPRAEIAARAGIEPLEQRRVVAVGLFLRFGQRRQDHLDPVKRGKDQRDRRRRDRQTPSRNLPITVSA